MRLKLFILIILFGSNFSFATAQSSGGDLTNILNSSGVQTIDLTLKPIVPQPNEEFEATLGVIDAGSQVSWFVDGKEIEENRNQKKLKLIAKKVGEPTTIRVRTTSPTGVVSETTRVLTPVYLDIILEPQTHVPDFYLGRPLPSYGSQINATTLISGINTPTSELVYRWEVGGEVLIGGATRGQSRISFEMPLGQYPVLSLQVTDLSGNLVASRFISIPTMKPEIKFYEKSSLFGLSQQPAGDPLTLIGRNNSIQAVPYYLDSRVYNDPDLIEWELENQKYSNLTGNPYEVTLQSSGDSGVVNLEFHVRNLDKLLQGARDSLRIRI